MNDILQERINRAIICQGKIPVGVDDADWWYLEGYKDGVEKSTWYNPIHLDPNQRNAYVLGIADGEGDRRAFREGS